MLAKCLIEWIVVLAWKLALSSNCVAAVHFVMTVATLCSHNVVLALLKVSSRSSLV